MLLVLVKTTRISVISLYNKTVEEELVKNIKILHSNLEKMDNTAKVKAVVTGGFDVGKNINNHRALQDLSSTKWKIIVSMDLIASFLCPYNY